MERRRSYVHFILVICLISSVNGFLDVELGGLRSSKDFDFLIFAQHWPQTVCFSWKEKSKTNDCSLPANEEWAIHGIWPTDYNDMGPSYCNKSLPFDPQAVAPLEQELKSKWIDVEKQSDHYGFWRHEWEKHGTCAAVIESMSTEYKYFQEGLKLLDTYDMKHVLGKGNVLPGMSYSSEKISSTIQNVLGKTSRVSCLKNRETGESYLFQIEICLDKELQLMDCGETSHSHSCDQSGDIMYPSTTPVGYGVVQV